jgi:hypothetical protein
MAFSRDAVEIQVGRIPTSVVETEHGSVHVEAMGFSVRVGVLHLRWLRPRRVTLERPNGQVERAPVQDGLGRVESVLAVAGLFVSTACLYVARRRTKTPDQDAGPDA